MFFFLHWKLWTPCLGAASDSQLFVKDCLTIWLRSCVCCCCCVLVDDFFELFSCFYKCLFLEISLKLLFELIFMKEYLKQENRTLKSRNTFLFWFLNFSFHSCLYFVPFPPFLSLFVVITISRHFLFPLILPVVNFSLAARRKNISLTALLWACARANSCVFSVLMTLMLLYHRETSPNCRSGVGTVVTKIVSVFISFCKHFDGHLVLTLKFKGSNVFDSFLGLSC